MCSAQAASEVGDGIGVGKWTGERVELCCIGPGLAFKKKASRNGRVREVCGSGAPCSGDGSCRIEAGETLRGCFNKMAGSIVLRGLQVGVDHVVHGVQRSGTVST